MLPIDAERVVAGNYVLSTIYLAKPVGQIGQDCFYYYSMAEPSGGLSLGQRSLFAFYAASGTILQSPVVGDPRYRFYRVSEIYPVDADGTIRFPVISETKEFTYTYRTIPLEQAIREITSVLSPMTPTPTR